MARRLGLLAMLVPVLVCLSSIGVCKAVAMPLPGVARVDADCSGEMRGMVTAADDGLALRRARVVLRHEATREIVSVQNTGKAGRFAFGQLPAGVYSLEASATGYLPAILAPIVVRVGRETRVERVSLAPDKGHPAS